ncbi:type II toxin-antitoxin system Phd/YefM family antitoxin [Gordonia aquimaris]|uniref:Uncharacterized protein n=1 Tax=Gordonia aquimaris TaxID=2984863 RepID=A0A9X3D7E1_9ACTN|nr:hypothetical protein [Gordonia aquimaris]MCX2966220.1 hypothetical protein [Gordonia aquimaris]
MVSYPVFQGMDTMNISEARSALSETVRTVFERGKTLGINVNGRTQAMLAPPTHTNRDLGAWFEAARSVPSHQLPSPLDQHAVDDGGVGACLWIHATSGAMIAAIPTGRWDTPGAHFAFYYSHPGLPRALHLDGWTYALAAWHNRSAAGYDERRKEVLELFRERAPRAN